MPVGLGSRSQGLKARPPPRSSKVQTHVLMGSIILAVCFSMSIQGYTGVQTERILLSEFQTESRNHVLGVQLFKLFISFPPEKGQRMTRSREKLKAARGQERLLDALWLLFTSWAATCASQWLLSVMYLVEWVLGCVEKWLSLLHHVSMA